MPFTKEAVEELSALRGEPEWLRARRLEAFGVFERMPLPDTKRQEDWRQVDLKGLDLNAYLPFQQPNGASPRYETEVPVGGVIRQRGTSVPKIELSDEARAKGVVLTSIAEAARSASDLVSRYLFTGVRADRDKFAALHGALFSGGTFLYVPDGVVLEQPLFSEYWSGDSVSAVLP
ncbi:MAG TPA: Fe-S cluster assembly protein SufD, partial [Candidatus Dormibacteraeota bacterium]